MAEGQEQRLFDLTESFLPQGEAFFTDMKHTASPVHAQALCQGVEDQREPGYGRVSPEQGRASCLRKASLTRGALIQLATLPCGDQVLALRLNRLTFTSGTTDSF